MKMRDRLIGLAESLESDLRQIDEDLAKHRNSIEHLEVSRLTVEEELLEARLVLRQLDYTGFRVRTLLASVDAETPAPV